MKLEKDETLIFLIFIPTSATDENYSNVVERNPGIGGRLHVLYYVLTKGRKLVMRVLRAKGL